MRDLADRDVCYILLLFVRELADDHEAGCDAQEGPRVPRCDPRTLTVLMSYLI